MASLTVIVLPETDATVANLPPLRVKGREIKLSELPNKGICKKPVGALLPEPATRRKYRWLLVPALSVNVSGFDPGNPLVTVSQAPSVNLSLNWSVNGFPRSALHDMVDVPFYA